MPPTANGVAQPFGASWGSTCWHLTSNITVSETLGNWQLGVNRISKAEQLGSACYVWWLCACVLQSFAGHVPELSEMPLTTALKTFRLEVITPSNFKLFAATVVLLYQGRQGHNFFWLRILAALHVHSGQPLFQPQVKTALWHLSTSASFSDIFLDCTLHRHTHTNQKTEQNIQSSHIQIKCHPSN